MQWSKIRGSYVVCLWEVMGLGSAFVEAVNLIEMKRERKGLLFSQVNEKLLVS